MALFLKEIHQKLKVRELLPTFAENILIEQVSLDSRVLKKNSIFIALKGRQTDGRHFVQNAIQNGAVTIYADEPLEPLPSDLLYFVVPNLREQLAALACFFYQDPSRFLEITAVTGTNGKTSIAHLLTEAQEALGSLAYYVGTLGWGHTHTLQPLSHTSPDIIILNHILAQAHQESLKYVNCEASSHGLDQGRLNDIQIHTAIFTNLTQDHLDYHLDMETYFRAKLKLFQRPELKQVILNIDDPYALRIQNCLDQKVFCITTSIKHQKADVYADIKDRTLQGSQVSIHVFQNSHTVFLPIASDFQISNLLAVLATLVTQGFSIQACWDILPKLCPVKGRMEQWSLASGGTVIIDYAHTPDALFQVLSALRVRYSKIVTVFGCGGNKDRTKRPLMAQAVERFSDHVIVTSDNSRFESFSEILHDIMSGFLERQKVMIEEDREKAILKALSFSGPGTVILLAGKGHETYLDVMGKKSHFDERDVLRKAQTDYPFHQATVSNK